MVVSKIVSVCALVQSAYGLQAAMIPADFSTDGQKIWEAVRQKMFS